MTDRQTFHPTALCQCGCGLAAPVAQYPDANRGWVKGEPMTYRRGHQAKDAATYPAARTLLAKGAEGCPG